MLAPALAALLAVLAGGLPPPPREVVFPAKLGDVAFRHDRHLDRREACRSCHEGKVGKVAIDKERGHALCTGCHKEKGGPTACSACHAIQGPGDGKSAR